MIVKIQVSQFTTHSCRRVLVYNENRSLQYEGDLTPDIEQLMRRRAKAFFYAHVITLHGENTFSIDKEAPWQSW